MTTLKSQRVCYSRMILARCRRPGHRNLSSGCVNMGRASRRKRDRRGLTGTGGAHAPVEIIEAARRQAIRDAEVVAQLYRDRQRDYERTAAVLARPASTFVGVRAGEQVISISSRPQDPVQMIERFSVACLTLDALSVAHVVLLSGDEVAAELLAPVDVTSDLDCFMLVCAARRGLGGPSVMLAPYQLDRQSRTISWGQPRGLSASETQGLWAQVLVPRCFAGNAGSGPGALGYYLARNRELDNDVLLLDTSAAN